MNVTDFDSSSDDPNLPKDGLKRLFYLQRRLMGKYHDIEMASGLMQTELCPVDIHDRRGQARLKDFAWRVTEELAEAAEAHQNNHEALHVREEAMDALHFFIELSILSGAYASDLYPYPDGPGDLLELSFRRSSIFLGQLHLQLENRIFQVVVEIGKAMNTLKQKPWKTTHMLTDVNRYQALMRAAWLCLIDVFLCLNMTAGDVLDLYTRKNKVNQFRQASAY